MKRLRKNQQVKQGQKILTDLYFDGSLTTVECEVICDSGELVSFYYFNQIFPEYGRQIKCLPKKSFYIL